MKNYSHKILHLTEDEKFTDHIIRCFEEVAENKSVYFIEIKKDQKALKYIQSSHHNIITDTTESQTFNSLVKRLQEFDAVILHNLYTPYKQNIVLKAPDNVHFHWMSWGGDLYIHPQLLSNIYHKSSKKIISNQKNIFGLFGDFMNRQFPHLWDKAYLRSRQIVGHYRYQSIIKKTSSFSTVLPNEVPLVHKYYHKHLKYLPFKYLMFDQKSNENEICSGSNFLIGNSATTTNNHLEAFSFLQNSNLNTSQIIVPLSYGEPDYAELIINKGQKIFGERFNPMTNFIPLDDYIKVMNSCGNVVMNHYRQQAMGNILVSLWKGARVYLNRKNLVWQFLKENNIIFFNINDINHHENLPDFETLARHNRPILEKLYGSTQVLKETRELVDYLTNNKK